MSKASAATVLSPVQSAPNRDFYFATAVVIIIAFFFLPIPSILIDFGLALSIALAVSILMLSLWTQKPLEFSSFPTILLVATILRLALNIASTRLILSHGAEGITAAGYIIGGFSKLVMGGDFAIGIIVFIILVTVNFLVITKGATRIAEVGARFTLDAIPGKQMAIDADLSAGMIDDKEARRRRRELEEESAFFGAMDGASKFVRGDAIAGIIILCVNIFGGMMLGIFRYNMPFSQAADVFTKLSVGEGLVAQIPALIVSLGAGLLVSKGGVRGSAEQAIIGQFTRYPRALMVAAGLLFTLALMPGLPFTPFAALGGILVLGARFVPKPEFAEEVPVAAVEAAPDQKEAMKEYLRTPEMELCFGRQLAAKLVLDHDALAVRVTKLRRKFAKEYGFIVPEIKLSDSVSTPPRGYEIKIHGTVVGRGDLRPGEVLVVTGDGPAPAYPGDEVQEPAFGLKAYWIAETFQSQLKSEGFVPVDGLSVLLTHLSEVVRNNLSQLLSYKDMRSLMDRLEPEYKKLVEDLCPAQISFPGLQSVLKLLLAERVSIRNLHLVLEAIAEIAPHVRRAEQVAEHVRIKLSQQICGDISQDGVLKVLRLGSRWDLAFHQSLKRDPRGEVTEFDLDPRLLEEFSTEAGAVIRAKMAAGHRFAILTASDSRPYVRMIIERLFPTLPVLSHAEVARGVQVSSLGSVS
jgi:flagellar biosynthesis protein FlhA